MSPMRQLPSRQTDQLVQTATPSPSVCLGESVDVQSSDPSAPSTTGHTRGRGAIPQRIQLNVAHLPALVVLDDYLAAAPAAPVGAGCACWRSCGFDSSVFC